MRRLLTTMLFPLWFLGAIFAAVLGYRSGMNESVILGIVTFSTGGMLLLMERVHPAHVDWNRSRGDVGTDTLHVVFSMILLQQGLDALLKAGLLGAAVAVSHWFGGAIWPSHWPLILQVLMAMIISQFGEYWAHRMGHEIPFLWRFHATHHSPHRLYFLNAARFHPVDAAVLFVVAMAPLILLGAGTEVLLVYSVWVGVHGLFQHANLKVRLGPLNYLFSMAELHRWHHSHVLEEANANYGNNILFWDLVFGTVYWPRDRDASQAVGLTGLDAFPEGYLGQLAAPFRWPSIVAESTSEERLFEDR